MGIPINNFYNQTFDPMNDTKLMYEMNHLKLLLLAVFTIASSTLISAQSNSPSGILVSNDVSAKQINNDSWSYFSDEESKTFYIDFETINFNIKTVSLKDQFGKVVFNDQVSDLPVNTIYELDCSAIPSGQYSLEIHSYTGIKSKNVVLK